MAGVSAHICGSVKSQLRCKKSRKQQQQHGGGSSGKRAIWTHVIPIVLPACIGSKGQETHTEPALHSENERPGHQASNGISLQESNGTSSTCVAERCPPIGNPFVLLQHPIVCQSEGVLGQLPSSNSNHCVSDGNLPVMQWTRSGQRYLAIFPSLLAGEVFCAAADFRSWKPKKQKWSADKTRARGVMRKQSITSSSAIAATFFFCLSKEPQKLLHMPRMCLPDWHMVRKSFAHRSNSKRNKQTKRRAESS